MDTWGIVAKMADVSGVISLIVAIITLILAGGIKTSILKFVEKNDYKQDIDKHLTNLQAILDSYNDPKTQASYNEETLDQLLYILETFQGSYDMILTKKNMKGIDALSKHIENKCKKDISNVQYKRECRTQLHKLILRLGKEKMVI